MKTLFVIRHAKSSWKNEALPDYDRPLNERGKKDAANMAKRLIERQGQIDLFVSSPAKRAKSTALLFCRQYHYSTHRLELVKELYEAEPETIYDTLSALDPALARVALVGHNPGLTAFVNSLTQVQIDNLPTCSIFAVRAAIQRWQDFRTAPKQFIFFDYPKSNAMDRG
jgi:phosphohistidine phosphatase